MLVSRSRLWMNASTWFPCSLAAVTSTLVKRSLGDSSIRAVRMRPLVASLDCAAPLSSNKNTTCKLRSLFKRHQPSTAWRRLSTTIRTVDEAPFTAEALLQLDENKEGTTTMTTGVVGRRTGENGLPTSHSTVGGVGQMDSINAVAFDSGGIRPPFLTWSTTTEVCTG
jgi:hypothetical protein